MGRRLLLLWMVLGSAACGGTNAVDPGCDSPAGSITDLGSEPPYSAAYLHRWSIDSCPVRLDVLMSRDGGCGPNDMVMGTPLGTSTVNGTSRIYVGGDISNLVSGPTAAFDPAALLPPSATDTGFRQSARELWMVPNDDGFVFLRSSDGHVEAWPLERSLFGCL